MSRDRGSHSIYCALAVCALGLVSCNEPTIEIPQNNDGGGSPGIANLESIQVMPGDVSLTLASDTPQTQKYQAIGKFTDGHTEDITERVTWAVSPSSLGGFSKVSLFESGRFGGDGQVYARSGTLFGTGKLALRVTRRFVEADAPGADEGKFTGPADAQSPQVVYPYDQVLMPPNLGLVEVHFTKGNAAHSLFEISLQSRTTDIRVYTACTGAFSVGGGCVYDKIVKNTWDLVAYSNAGSTDPVVVTIRSTDGKTVGTSKAIGMRFGGDKVLGGLYYWTAEGGVIGIYRIDFEHNAVEPYYLTPESPRDHQNKQVCIGCHAISHDGKRMNVVLGGAHVSDLVQLDVEKKQRTLTKINTVGANGIIRQFSNLQAYNADGSSFIAALRGTLRLVSSETGNDLIAAIQTGGRATHPDWSRSGGYLAFTRFSDLPTDPATLSKEDGDSFEIYVTKGGIGYAKWNGTAFEQPTQIIAEKAGQNSYYPTMAPNDDLIAFNRIPSCDIRKTNADNNNDCTAYDNPKAQIYMISRRGGAELPLTNLNKRGPNDSRDDLTNSWPKWSPFLQAPMPGTARMWLTFSSKRNYGLRIRNNTTQPQLWMGAVTVSGEPMGGDASSPPFWIPNQKLATHNHIAQWTEQIVPVVQ